MQSQYYRLLLSEGNAVRKECEINHMLARDSDLEQVNQLSAGLAQAQA